MRNFHLLKKKNIQFKIYFDTKNMMYKMQSTFTAINMDRLALPKFNFSNKRERIKYKSIKISEVHTWTSVAVKIFHSVKK